MWCGASARASSSSDAASSTKQEGVPALGVEHDREQDPVVLRRPIGLGDEHGLAREAPGLRPDGRLAGFEVGLDDGLQPPGLAHPDAPDVAIGPLVAPAVVDPRQLDRGVAETLGADRAGVGVDPEAPELRPGDGLAGAQAFEVEVLHDLRVVEDADVDHHLVAVLVGIDVVKAEAGVGGERPSRLARGPIQEGEAGAELGLPAVVLDVRAAAGRQPERVDHERELGQHEPAFAEAERVHVRGLADPPARDHLRLAGAGRQMEEAVLVARSEGGRVVEHPLAGAVEVRVCRRQHPRDLVGDAGRFERLGVELDRDGGLGHRDEALAELGQVHVGVVRELRREHRAHALEERPARVGRELRELDLARVARGAVRAGLAGSDSRRRPSRRRSRTDGASPGRRTNGSSCAPPPPTSPGRCGSASPRARPEAHPTAPASRPRPRSRATRIRARERPWRRRRSPLTWSHRTLQPSSRPP